MSGIKTGSSGTSTGSGGLTPTPNSTAITAVAGNHYLTDTRSAAYTITLPTGATGAVVRFSDTYDNWAVNNLTIAPATGQKIDGLATNENLVCDVKDGWVELSWNGSIWSFQSLASAANYLAYVPGTTAGVVPTAGLPGRTDGIAVAAGNVGQVITAVFTNQTLNTTPTAKASISLTAGSWLLSGQISTVGSSTTQYVRIAVTSVSGGGGTFGIDQMIGATNTSGYGCATVAGLAVNLSSTTTYYANVDAGASTPNCYGNITAVRIA